MDLTHLVRASTIVGCTAVQLNAEPKMRHLKTFGLWLACFSCVATFVIPNGSVHADGLEIAFFNIDHDAETGALEIVHRFFVQDIEIALEEITGQAIHFEDPESLNAVVQPYMESRFSLSTLEGIDLITEWSGVEARANTLLIRQSAVLPPTAGGVVVRNRALHETHPRHVNILHATLNEQTYKRDFLANGPPQKLTLE